MARGELLKALGITVWRRRQAKRPVDEPTAEIKTNDDQSAPAQAPVPTAKTLVPGGATSADGAPAAPVPQPLPPTRAPDSGPADMAPLAESSPQSPTEAVPPALDWPALEQAVHDCQACPLHRSRTRGVFGIGRHDARLLIIGEAPGYDEDKRGEPFVGRAGQLLDKMLQAVAMDRESVYIANILKSRPPNNRDPLPEEIAACWPYLSRQIELISPRLILAMGRFAAQCLLESDRSIGELRGQVHCFRGPGAPPDGIALIATYHPAYLLRRPREKAKSWQDWRLALVTLSR